MARKVFMSVLGSTSYNECCYVDDNLPFKSSKTKFVQIAMLEKLKSEWNSSDIAYIFVTQGDKGSEKKNWNDNGHFKFATDEVIESKGLNSFIEELNLELKVEPIQIKNGDNESEIWENFRIIFDCLQPDDEVYFDVTHGFRSLPMMVMVLNNYSKFLKGIKVKSISYGNYEARNELNEAPIIDLTPLTNLQDWTSAIKEFIDYGKSKSINDLLGEYSFVSKFGDTKITMQFRSQLEKLEGLFQTLRGKEIYSGKIFKEIQGSINALKKKTNINPLKPILEKVSNKISVFSQDEDLWNGINAAYWCFNHELFQQAYTIAQESIISLLCVHCFKDYKSKTDRQFISSCIGSSYNYLHNIHKWRNENDEERELYIKWFKNELIVELSRPFSELSGLRNSMNHAGIIATHSYTDFKNNFHSFDNCVGILKQHLNHQ